MTPPEAEENTWEEMGWDADDSASRFFWAFCDWMDAELQSVMVGGVDFEKRGPDKVHLDHLFVPDELRDHGWGTRIMRKMIELADLHAVALTLNPAPLDDDPKSATLSKWYERFGFETTFMQRLPRVQSG